MKVKILTEASTYARRIADTIYSSLSDKVSREIVEEEEESAYVDVRDLFSHLLEFPGLSSQWRTYAATIKKLDQNPELNPPLFERTLKSYSESQLRYFIKQRVVGGLPDERRLVVPSEGKLWLSVYRETGSVEVELDVQELFSDLKRKYDISRAEFRSALDELERRILRGEIQGQVRGIESFLISVPYQIIICYFIEPADFLKLVEHSTTLGRKLAADVESSPEWESLMYIIT